MDGSIDFGWVWAIGFAAFAGGTAIGLSIGFLAPGKRQRVQALEREIADLQQQFNDYRQQVSEHFLTTSALVQKMTDSYRDVYEHLASGSQVLCQTPVNTPSLDFTEQPVLDIAVEDPAKAHREQPPERLESEPMDDSENDSCIGDAPHVPKLDTEQPANHRTL